MTDIPSFDALKRGHVVLVPDPFKADDEATRPWVVVNTEDHPFDRDQYVVMGLTTKTWYEARLPLEMVPSVVVFGSARQLISLGSVLLCW